MDPYENSNSNPTVRDFHLSIIFYKLIIKINWWQYKKLLFVLQLILIIYCIWRTLNVRMSFYLVHYIMNLNLQVFQMNNDRINRVYIYIYIKMNCVLYDWINGLNCWSYIFWREREREIERRDRGGGNRGAANTG